MEIFIFISFGIVMVLLIAFIGRKLGRTAMPRQEEIYPWEDDEVVPGSKIMKRNLDNDPHVIGSAEYSLHRDD